MQGHSPAGQYLSRLVRMVFVVCVPLKETTRYGLLLNPLEEMLTTRSCAILFPGKFSNSKKTHQPLL